ncbi:hypothetical protein ACHAP5_001439 [Fusarium lateritium]
MDHKRTSPRDAVLAHLAAFPLDIPQDVLDRQECGRQASPPRDFADDVDGFIVRVTGTEECRPEWTCMRCAMIGRCLMPLASKRLGAIDWNVPHRSG